MLQDPDALENIMAATPGLESDHVAVGQSVVACTVKPHYFELW